MHTDTHLEVKSLCSSDYIEAIELPNSLLRCGITKEEIVGAIDSIQKEGQVTPSAVCVRLGLQPYSIFTFNGKPRDTLAFKELKGLLYLIPEVLKDGKD